MKRVSSPKEAIEILGGIQATADLTKRKYGAVCNWNGFDRFPKNTYLILKSALQDRGFEAPDSLWGMLAPEKENAA
jgi:hypothetical protein